MKVIAVALGFSIYFTIVFVCSHYDAVVNLRKEFDKL
jgi:hypothetical protein